MLSACRSNSCNTLRQRDELIHAEFRDVKSQYDNGRMALQQYLEKLRGLRKQEELLFEEARACEKRFVDLTEYNYWFRGRLKFPGSLEMELKRLEE